MYFQEQPDNFISNLYDVNAVNKTFLDLPLSFRLKGFEGSIRVLGDSLVLKSQDAASAKLFVMMKRDRIKMMNTPIMIEVYGGVGRTTLIQTSFLGPVQKKVE
jgi:hypothetical protein